MTPEVKKRIEQIRQGIVPEGYVKDKDGIYPRDWASKKIGQWLKLAERTIVLQDEEEYQLVTVRRGFGGVDSRGSFLGKNVLVKNYFIVKTGDFIISKRQIAHGACGIVPPELDGAVVSNEYNVFLPQDGTNIQMFNLMMQLPHYKRLFYLMSDGVHIEKLLFKTQDWMKRKLAMPLLKEQKKIAEILSTQDKTIELQGRKIEELKRFKKGCLEKMFPRKGQKVPEKRFPGFTDDWEQRKLGDIGKARSGVGFPDAEQGGVTGIPFFKVSDMNLDGNESEMTVANNYVTAEQIAVHRWSPITELPAIFFAKVGAAVMLNRKRLCRFPFLLDNNTMAYSLSSTKWDADFAKALFGTVDLTSLVQVGALPSYNAGDVESMEIYLPSLLEQEQIGGFFKQLDNLITLHQRKLEEMKNQKKALMQLLLTGIERV
ncbi:MAG TPA: restriction endonuclease subunit S [Clostridiales bacterium]|jgi:type I restriction enzyme S subunit|nr:restriction endonuclease subunit S [Clostridiales bacterium]